MREYNHRRRFRNQRTQMASSHIRKDILPYDSCDIFPLRRGFERQIWMQNLEKHNTAGLYRADTFGINDYHLDYSLKKKKRWLIPDEIVERIEEIQDPYLNLRVSASVHGEERSECWRFWGWGLFGSPIEHLGCLEYHSVSRDGATITHRQSNKTDTRFRNFIHPVSRPKKTKDQRGRARYREMFDFEGRDLAYDEKLEYQPLHINYTTVLFRDRPSLHNKAARKGRADSPRKISKKYAYMPIEIVTDREINADVMEMDAVIDEDTNFPPYASPILMDLSSLIVKREKRTRKRKKPRHRFVDEKSMSVQTFNYVSEAEEQFIAIEKPSLTVASYLGPECFARIPLISVSDLQSMRRLPCFPPAWKIPLNDTRRVLGFHHTSPIIAKQIGEMLGLSEDSSSSRLPDLGEDAPLIHTDSGVCKICYKDMHEERADPLSRPFSLSCSHLFCIRCWLSHVSESIQRKRLPTACLDPDCPITLSVWAAMGLLDSSSLHLYNHSLIETLNAQGKLFSCPQCERLHYANGTRSFQCSCDLVLCTHCSLAEHFPVGCDVYRQYNNYMHRSGYALSIVCPLTAPPIVSDLVQCPSCKEFMQRVAGCNRLICTCGTSFCFSCGKSWNLQHVNCDVGLTSKVVLMDAFQLNSCSLIAPSLLTLAVQSRIVLLERRKELRARLKMFPNFRRIEVERKFIKLSLLIELCYLNSRRNHSSKQLATRIRIELDYFFNTNDSRLTVKACALEKLHNCIHQKIFLTSP